MTKNIKSVLNSNILWGCIGFLTVTMVLSSCSLEEEMKVDRAAIDYYKNQQECETAVIGMYAAAQWIYKANFFELVELPTDYARTNKTNETKNRSLAQYQWTPQHASILGFYSDAFAAINRFNNVIRSLKQVTFLTDEDKNRMLGEAYFLRGLLYLNLTRVFGELPVKTEETLDSKTDSYPKWSNEDIFTKVILPDLSFADQHLPLSAMEPHRASGIAAKALLARTYLWLASCGKNGVMYHQWVSQEGKVQAFTDSVKKKCLEIMQQPQYGLYDSFYDVWMVDYKTAKNGVVEHLFAINFDYENAEGNPYGAWFHNYYGSAAPGWDLTPGREPVLLGQGYDGMSPSKEFWQEINIHPYDKRDTTMFTLRHGNTVRKNTFIAEGGITDSGNQSGAASNLNAGTNFGIVKYRFQKGLETSASGSAQLPVIRFSDVLLMYAEACGPSDVQGVEAFNRVRQRAYEMLDYHIQSDDPEILNDEQTYLNAVLTERKIELCFERSRWFDLVRTHSLGETIRDIRMSYNTTNGVQILDMSQFFDDEEKRSFFPLPSLAIELNKGLEQNSPWK